jgi:2-dehydrotetronate isomerase
MPSFSANLGFLWSDLALPDAIMRAASAGFDAVECHWPYAEDAETVKGALAATGLAMLGLNTAKGGNGEFGLAALAGRETEARDGIDAAIAYADAIHARNIHVMAGKASGTAARDTFLANLDHAARAASASGRTILIEPINGFDVPGYFLTSTSQAADIIAELGHANVKLMFDCYHVQISEGDLTRMLERLLPIIGHIQFAAVPDRGEPDRGEIDYRHIFRHIDSLGYDRPIGAEYRPRTTTDAGLGWLAAAKSAKSPLGS